MKTLILFCLLCMYAVNVFSQSSKLVTSGTNPIHKPQAIIQDAQDNSTVYKLDFAAADLSLISGNTSAQANACTLTDKNGTVYNGTVYSSSAASTYTCSFTKDDLNKIVAQKIVQIEINGANSNNGTYLVNDKLQNSITKQIKDILNQLNTANPE